MNPGHQNSTVPRLKRLLISCLSTRRSRKYVVADIEERYLETLQTKGSVEAKKYLNYEIRLMLGERAIEHVVIMFLIEGATKIAQLMRPFW